MIERVRTLATSFVTYAIIAVATLNAAVGALEPFEGTPYVEHAVTWVTWAASALAGAVAIVRNVVSVRGTDLVGLQPVDTVVARTEDLLALVDDEDVIAVGEDQDIDARLDQNFEEFWRDR